MIKLNFYAWQVPSHSATSYCLFVLCTHSALPRGWPCHPPLPIQWLSMRLYCDFFETLPSKLFSVSFFTSSSSLNEIFMWPLSFPPHHIGSSHTKLPKECIPSVLWNQICLYNRDFLCFNPPNSDWVREVRFCDKAWGWMIGEAEDIVLSRQAS